MIPHKKRRRLTIRAVLSIIVLFTAARAFMRGNYEHLFLCVLTLLLFCVPMVIDRTLGIDLPPVLETIIYCFIFSAEILGEINSYYTKIPYWDTMLHTINGFLMAAIGFALVDIFNRSERFSVKLSPLFLAIVAFCFSMTVGVFGTGLIGSQTVRFLRGFGCHVLAYTPHPRAELAGLAEYVTAEELFRAPREDYTRQLIAAIPTRDRRLLPEEPGEEASL